MNQVRKRRKMSNKEILIVSDIAGVGKVSSNVLYPILTVAQFSPAILPTYLLSSNTEAGNMVTQSTDTIFSEFLKRWQQQNINFSAYVTGYFTRSKQISLFKAYFLKQKQQNQQIKLCVDPTMGDMGELYIKFDDKIVEEIRSLIQYADIVKPNITEACILTGHPYKELMSIDEMTELAHKVNQLGAKNTILTGIKREDRHGKKKIGILYYDEHGQTNTVFHKYFDQDFFGTGDILFSFIVSFYLSGFSISDAVHLSAMLIEKALANTLELERDLKYGIYYESVLSHFDSLIHEISNK